MLSEFRFPSFRALAALFALVQAAPASASPGEALLRMVELAGELGPRAAYVFDLDETIVDSTPRRFLSILAAFDEACAPEIDPPDACRAAEKLDIRGLYGLRNRYEVETFLAESGVGDAGFAKRIVEESFGLYLSGDWVLEEDRLYPGAQAFIRELKAAGARVFFVSSRPSKTMRRPTLEFLRRRGLIREGEASHLYLKGEGERSVEFKRRAVEDIRGRMEEDGGRVVGLFENEPRNLRVWTEVVPSARAFFVLGAYDQESTIPAKSVLLEDFRL